MSKAKEVAAQIFKVHKDQDEAYITADNRGFTEEHRADAYAQRLKSRKVKKFVRGEDNYETIENKPDGDLISNTAAAVGGNPDDKAKEDAKAQKKLEKAAKKAAKNGA